ncbi:hypothetical protein NKH18_18645 [Streptomyces sp. M10(2022)]
MTVYLNGRRIAGHGDGKVEKNLQYETPDGTSGEGTRSPPASASRSRPCWRGPTPWPSRSTSATARAPTPTSGSARSRRPPTPSRSPTRSSTPSTPPTPSPPRRAAGTTSPGCCARSTPHGTPLGHGANEALPKGTTYDELTAVNDRTAVDINNAPPGRPIRWSTRHLWTARAVRTGPWLTGWAPPSAASTSRR